MTLSEMQSYVSYLVDDPQMTYFTPTQLTAFLNHAQEETQKVLIQAGQNYFLKIYSFNTTTNLGEYALPADFLKVNRLEYVEGTPPNDFITALSSITLNQKDAFSLYAQWPQVFYFGVKGFFNLVPIPQAVCAMKMTYTYRLPDLSAPTDVSEIPEEFQKYMCFVAAKLCFIKDQRDPSSLFTYTNEVETALKREAVERAQDRSPTIVRTECDDAWGWG